MTAYDVFPGVRLIYNELHMQRCVMEKTPPNIVEIHHCREGRIEYKTGRGEYQYIGTGDLAIQRKLPFTAATFPLSHYQGITISIDLNKAPHCLSCIMDDVSLDLHALFRRFCHDSEYTVIRSDPAFSHIFSELYSVPENIRKGYFKLKILELLLFLSGMTPEQLGKTRQYFSKPYIDKVKAIKLFLAEHSAEHITLDELSARFDIPLTAMKACFKEVYGTSVYAYIRHYKMQKAGWMLRHTDKNVLEIAGEVGYGNGSKFAKAFSDVMGCTPSAYRNLSD